MLHCRLAEQPGYVADAVTKKFPGYVPDISPVEDAKVFHDACGTMGGVCGLSACRLGVLCMLTADITGHNC